MSIIKVKNEKVCGGFTSVPWKHDGTSNSDIQSFLFSLTNLKKYPLIKINGATIYNNSEYGPAFDLNGCILGLYSDKMNDENRGRCYPNREAFKIPADSEGRSEITGEKNSFTCTEVEVYLIKQA